ncbi:DUF1631 family protein [Caenimonas terrae]|uniref:DUF1631 family protein n=1 Tax=Caenimonas terrae TaxID=696074 RepID=A0ABW0NEK0_9BURK
MANPLKLRLGVSDDPTALQPNLNDCLSAMLQHAQLLMGDVLTGLTGAADPAGSKRASGLQAENIQQAVRDLALRSKQVCETYKDHLTRIVYEGGGKEQSQGGEMLRYEDLQLFGDSELDQSIEVARAQQEVSMTVDDVLPTLDALISTLLGWRTIQSGLNPVRPEVFVRALQATLAEHVPDAAVREALITPAAGLLGVNLRRLYRELSDWLKSCGIEPAVPVGGRLYQGGGATGKQASNSVANTLLTLDRLRLLLAGDLDAPKNNDQMLTVPASLMALQDLKQVDAMVLRLQKRPKPEAAAEPAQRAGIEGDAPAAPRLGHQLAEEVVRLMFDNLLQDQRLMEEFKRQLKLMQPAVFTLAQHDSRFFSDRSHPARMFLDRITQRSLAFSSAADDGWKRFLGTVEDSVRWLDSKVVDAEVFGELLDHLQEQWSKHDQVTRGRRETAARALLHAEQRNLLAQKLAGEFGEAMEANEVPAFVGDFLKGSWAQVVAEAQLSCVDGSDDPYGYRAVVDDLIWSVQQGTPARGRNQRLAQMIPSLLARLRDGLRRIDYPPELTTRFFDQLLVLHQAALDEGRQPGDPTAKELEALSLALPNPDNQPLITEGIPTLDQPIDVSDLFPELPPGTPVEQAGKIPFLVADEAHDSGYLDEDSYLPDEAPQIPDEAAEALPEPVGAAEIRTGTWVELMVNGNWLRVQLTWASPHATLFMFTSLAGTAHSMSRRTLERLRAQGLMKVVAERNVVDDALDQVARAALRNTYDGKS